MNDAPPLSPNALAAVALGRRPVCLTPQPGQTTRWAWCSLTRTAITGSSST
jgi:hypothetical protein